MTKGDAKAAALRWLDEATVGGGEIPAEQTADYSDRMNYLLPGALDFFAGQFPLTALHTVVRHPVKSLLPGGFAGVQVLPGAPYRLSVNGAASFWAEVQGTCLFRATGPGNEVLFTRDIDSPRTFVPVQASFAAPVSLTLEVTATYPSALRWAAAYGCPFPQNEVQPHTPYVAVHMPADYRALAGVMKTDDDGVRAAYSAYLDRGDGVFLLPCNAEGQFDFRYHRGPAALSPSVADSTVLDIDAAGESLLPLKLAVDLTAGTDETAALSYYLDRRLSGLLGAALAARQSARAVIEPVYTMG